MWTISYRCFKCFVIVPCFKNQINIMRCFHKVVLWKLCELWWNVVFTFLYGTFSSRSSFNYICNHNGSIILNRFSFARKTLIVWLIDCSIVWLQYRNNLNVVEKMIYISLDAHFLEIHWKVFYWMIFLFVL